VNTRYASKPDNQSLMMSHKSSIMSDEEKSIEKTIKTIDVKNTNSEQTMTILESDSESRSMFE
jgi:hypothetical protein